VQVGASGKAAPGSKEEPVQRWVAALLPPRRGDRDSHDDDGGSTKAPQEGPQVRGAGGEVDTFATPVAHQGPTAQPQRSHAQSHPESGAVAAIRVLSNREHVGGS
jgi:hypothetical protein